MRYLIFSDTHLTPRFEPGKCLGLKEAISDVDRVIINGDFWEGMIYTFDEFVSSAWSKELFPLLQAKRAIYIWGNHDEKKMADERVNLFSTEQTLQYTFTSGGKTFVVEHGNRVFPMLDQTIHFKLPGQIVKVAQCIERMGHTIMGSWFEKIYFSPMNNKIKKHPEVVAMNNDTYLVTGHTHLAEIDHTHHYINSGANINGQLSYLIIENGSIELIQKPYPQT